MTKIPPLFWRGRAALVLASASPRRVALLRQAGAEFTVVDPGPDRGFPRAMLTACPTGLP